MNSTSRNLEGRAVRVSRDLTAGEVAERVASLTRKAHELEAEAERHCDGRDTSYAAGCANEAAAIRRDIARLTPLLKNTGTRLS